MIGLFVFFSLSLLGLNLAIFRVLVPFPARVELEVEVEESNRVCLFLARVGGGGVFGKCEVIVRT